METATHLQELLAGLEVPNPEWWVQQPPQALRKLGESIAAQAKRALPDVRDLGSIELADGMDD